MNPNVDHNTRSVLDHGFVKLRNIAGPTRRTEKHVNHGPSASCMGGDGEDNWSIQPREFDADDTDVANSARMSFDASDRERGYEIEMKLNRYLMANRHMTPFESIEVWLEMKLPIFVARQFVRHRTATLNEVSGRYVTLPAQWYIPDIVGGAPVDKKQGQSNTLDAETQKQFRRDLDNACRNNYECYLHYIEQGVAPEHSRMFLHVNHYTHWLWKQDLRNLMGFLSLRQHGHAQVEAQVYADAVVELLDPQIPGLVALYKELMKI